jgi:hypothetical protein
MKTPLFCATAITLLSLLPACALADPVNLEPLGTGLPNPSAAATVNFDDLPGGFANNGNGISYDSPFIDNGVQFGKMFVGQTLSSNGNFDVIGGTPTGPLTLTDVAAGHNINLFTDTIGNVLAPDGHLGFPNPDAIGEGGFSLLFSTDESEFSFEILGGNGGTATVDFYKNDGTLLQAITLTNLFQSLYTFETDGLVKDIRGITITNDDQFGVVFDDLQFDTPSSIGAAPPVGTNGGVPEPATWALMLLGFGGLGAALRSARRRQALAT